MNQQRCGGVQVARTSSPMSPRPISVGAENKTAQKLSNTCHPTVADRLAERSDQVHLSVLMLVICNAMLAHVLLVRLWDQFSPASVEKRLLNAVAQKPRTKKMVGAVGRCATAICHAESTSAISLAIPDHVALARRRKWPNASVVRSRRTLSAVKRRSQRRALRSRMANWLNGKDITSAPRTVKSSSTAISTNAESHAIHKNQQSSIVLFRQT